jgi:hypothetical protein
MDINISHDPYRGSMRWSALFADMEAQLDAAGQLGRDQAVADLTRAERASVAIADRLRACAGMDVRLSLRDGTRVVGVVRDVGPAWFLLADNAREHLVPFSAVAMVAGLPDISAPPASVVLRRLGLGHALRAVARDRTVVRVLTTAGETVGRIDGVGADHVDVALVHPDSGRPTGERHTVALGALVLVAGL